jgi:hypothetical protein
VVDRLSLVPRLNAGVAVQVIDDDVLVLDGHTLSRLTGTPGLVLRSIDGLRSVRAVAAAVAATAVQGEVVDAVDGLESAGVLELVDAGEEPRYRRPAYVGVCEDRDLLVLLDLRTGDRPVLSDTAAEVWRLLADTGSVAATVAELEVDFPDAASLADDTADFVAELLAKGLLERA